MSHIPHAYKYIKEQQRFSFLYSILNLSFILMQTPHREPELNAK